MSSHTQRPTAYRTLRLRHAPWLAGAFVVLCGAATVSTVLAAEDPIPPDPASQTPSGGFATCFGELVDTWVTPGGAPFYGDDEDNVIMGTSGPDIIFGGDGIDRICQPESASASGIVLTNPALDDGIDVVHGDEGSDYIDGGTDGDQIYGDEGEDFLHGGAEADVLDGGSDNDTLHGNGGADGLDCGTGGVDTDTAYGGPGNDFLVPSPPQADRETFVQ